MKVKLHNENNDEPQFVPGIGVMTPNEWVELEDHQLEEFKAVNGFDITATNNLEVEGQTWPPEGEGEEPEAEAEEDEEE